jgi:hypothetical protein
MRTPLEVTPMLQELMLAACFTFLISIQEQMEQGKVTQCGQANHL